MKLEIVSEIAKKILKLNGKHAPQAILDFTTHCSIIVMPFDGLKEKELVRLRLREEVEKKKPDKYFTIFESWVRNKKREIIKEALVITEYNPNLEIDEIFIEFKRVGKEIIIVEEREGMTHYKEYHSKWNFYLDVRSNIYKVDVRSNIYKVEEEGLAERFRNFEDDLPKL